MMKIFVLASGRSGTKFLSEIFKKNIENCISKHEPYPDMFGKPIYWKYHGSKEDIYRLFRWKKRRIESYKKDVYIETNHAFVKSFSDIAIKYFPDMKLIHLIRNPLFVAKSEMNKHIAHDKIYFPINYYKGDDGNKYYRWALTGLEDIFKDVKLNNLSLYQKYLLQWIEIENQSIRFLEKNQKQSECITLTVPEDLNDKKSVKNMFDFFNLKMKNQSIILKGKKNKNHKPTIVKEKERKELIEIVGNLPHSYLEIFQKKPYRDIQWINEFFN